MEKIQVESLIQLIRLWKRYRSSSFFYINDEKKLIESNLDAINSKDLSIFYCILGIYYKRNPSTNFVAEKYFKKCLSLSSNIPDIAALCTFELISIYAETNRSALAYTYCEKSRSIFNRLQNYTTCLLYTSPSPRD